MLDHSRLPEEAWAKAFEDSAEEDRLSSWYATDLSVQLEDYCKGCPIRPPGEDSCFLRFSNYPGMDSFRTGFLLTALYAETLDEKTVKDAPFSFPYVDRKSGQLPRDKIRELDERIGDVEDNREPERAFNFVADVIDALGLEGTAAEKLSLADAGLADKFIFRYIYRLERYSPEEASELRPYVETLREVAQWAVLNTDDIEARARLMSFEERMDRLVVALEYAEKYGLELRMSY